MISEKVVVSHSWTRQALDDFRKRLVRQIPVSDRWLDFTALGERQPDQQDVTESQKRISIETG